MTTFHLSRRRFALLGAAAAADQAVTSRLGAQPAKSGSRPLAGALADRILSNSQVAPKESTVDGFKAGGEQTPVRGIAVTAMATVDVLRQAAKSGLNMVVTFEPTFFGRTDASPTAPQGRFGGRAIPQDDPVLEAKRKFIESNDMAVFRFYDHWVGRKGNDLAVALGNALGWSKYRSASDPTSFQIPPVVLSTLVPYVKAQLKVNGGLRAVGDPAASVRRVVLLPGVQPLAAFTARLPESDLIITGEWRDWEGAEYGADAAAAGEKKGMISVGRVVSEDPGMRACADWIKTFVTEVPVQWIATGDPYWRPA